MTGTVAASVFPNRDVVIDITWDNQKAGKYGGVAQDDGYVHNGITLDANPDADFALWNSTTPLKCMDAAPPPAVQPPVEEKPATPPVEEKPATPAAKTVKVSGDVEIYDVPGGSGDLIGILREDTQVEVLERKPDNWDHVASASMPGGSGWVWGDYIPAE